MSIAQADSVMTTVGTVAQALTQVEFIVGYSALVIGGFAIVCASVFLLRAKSLKEDLDAAIAIVNKAVGEIAEPATARLALARAWHQGDLDSLYEVKSVTHAWHEFVECLIIPSPEEIQNGSSIRNTRDPDHYFNREHVVTTLSLRFFDSVPGILTGLGILGTFLGLAAGIYLAQGSGLAAGNTEQVQGALQQLLGGASLAFITSIAGLSTSIVFLFVMRLVVGQVDESLATWNHVLDVSLERTTPEKVAVLQLDELKEQTVELKTFNTELVISIAAALEEKVAGKLAPALDRIAEATESLQKHQSTATEDMLTSIVDRFSETMTGAAGQEFEAIANSLGGLDETLQNTITSMREQEERSARALDQLSGQVTQTLSEGSVQMRKGFEESIQMMMDSTKATHDDLSNRFEQMTESLASVAKDNSEQLGQQIGAAIGKASGELDSVTGKMVAALGDAGTSAASRIDESATSLAERTEGLARSLADAEKLTARLGQASEIVQQAAAGLGAVLDGLKTITPALTASSSEIGSAGDAISRASATIGNFGEVATTAARQLSEANDKVRESWERYVDRFEGSDEALAAVVAEMEAGLDSFTERVTEFNQGVDRDFSKSVQMLTSAIEELDQTLDERVSE